MTVREKWRRGTDLADRIVALLRDYEKVCKCEVLAIGLRDDRLWLQCVNKPRKKRRSARPINGARGRVSI